MLQYSTSGGCRKQWNSAESQQWLKWEKIKILNFSNFRKNYFLNYFHFGWTIYLMCFKTHWQILYLLVITNIGGQKCNKHTCYYTMACKNLKLNNLWLICSQGDSCLLPWMNIILGQSLRTRSVIPQLVSVMPTKFLLFRDKICTNQSMSVYYDWKVYTVTWGQKAMSTKGIYNRGATGQPKTTFQSKASCFTFHSTCR